MAGGALALVNEPTDRRPAAAERRFLDSKRVMWVMTAEPAGHASGEDGAPGEPAPEGVLVFSSPVETRRLTRTVAHRGWLDAPAAELRAWCRAASPSRVPRPGASHRRRHTDMHHAIRYEGSFERNFPALRPGAADYEGDDGGRHPLPRWPATADGLRFGFMEQRGKRFVAVRVQYGGRDVALKHAVPLDPARHLGGRRFSAEPIALDDGPAGALFGDILDANPEQRAELIALRDEVRQALAAEPTD